MRGRGEEREGEKLRNSALETPVFLGGSLKLPPVRLGGLFVTLIGKYDSSVRSSLNKRSGVPDVKDEDEVRVAEADI